MKREGQDIRLPAPLLAGTWRFFGSFTGRYVF